MSNVSQPKKVVNSSKSSSEQDNKQSSNSGADKDRSVALKKVFNSLRSDGNKSNSAEDKIAGSSTDVPGLLTKIDNLNLNDEPMSQERFPPFFGPFFDRIEIPPPELPPFFDRLETPPYEFRPFFDRLEIPPEFRPFFDRIEIPPPELPPFFDRLEIPPHE